MIKRRLIKNVKKMNENIYERLISIESLLKEGNLTQKEILTFEETASYLGFGSSTLYQLTSNRKIPHYKPNGKKVFFRRVEIDDWIISNRISTKDEIDERGVDYIVNFNN